MPSRMAIGVLWWFIQSMQAWRYPCYAVTDLQLFKAVLPPPGIALADNSITYSDRGYGNTLLAGLLSCFWSGKKGTLCRISLSEHSRTVLCSKTFVFVTGGDLDGDDVQVSFNEKLISIVRATQAAVQRMRPYLKALEADVLANAAAPCTAWQQDRGCLFFGGNSVEMRC